MIGYPDVAAVSDRRLEVIHLLLSTTPAANASPLLN
jgi:hypothetical protein